MYTHRALPQRPDPRWGHPTNPRRPQHRHHTSWRALHAHAQRALVSARVLRLWPLQAPAHMPMSRACPLRRSASSWGMLLRWCKCSATPTAPNGSAAADGTEGVLLMFAPSHAPAMGCSLACIRKSVSAHAHAQCHAYGIAQLISKVKS